MKFLKKKQNGVTVLIFTTSLLLISMLFILFATQYGLLQQKISADFYRNQQAFQAAQAGLEAALPYFQSNYSAIVAGRSGGYLTAYVNSSTHNVALANGSKYTFVYTNPTANNYQLIQVTSTGTNADGSSTRTLKQQIQAYKSGMPTPTVSLTTQGSVSLANTASINNTQTNANISSGSSISISPSADTTTSSGVSSTSTSLGNDVTQNSTALSSLSADNFFQNTFGVTQSALKSNATLSYTFLIDQSYNILLNGVTGAIIWVDQLGGTAFITSTTVVGSSAQPVILIVNGNLTLGGSAVINGFIFVLNPTATILIQQNAIINGAIASTGSLSFQNASALNYNSSILGAVPAVNINNDYAKVPASWRDF